jgi:ankyrin repeat protein
MKLSRAITGLIVAGVSLPAWAAQMPAAGRTNEPAPGVASGARTGRDTLGNTPLHKAVEASNLAEVQRLLAAKADPNALNRYRVSPLGIAVLNGHTAIATALLAAGADANAVLGEGEPVMLTAARLGNVELVRALITAGGDVNARERFYGQTPLMWAALEDHAEVIGVLVEAGADVNARANILEGEPTWRYGRDSRNGINGEALQNFNTNFSKGGLTALMYAARQGASGAVKALMARGANAATTDPEGYSALHLAIMNAHFDAAAALVETGANVNQTDRSGQTPLFALTDIRSLLWAYNRPTPRAQNEIGSLDLAKLLIAKGAKVDTKLTGPARRPLGGGGAPIAGRGATAFIRAAVTSDLPMMRLLLEHGADPKVVTQNGDTALHAAAGVRWADTTMSTAKALGFGVEADSIEAVKMLLERGLDVNAVDNAGLTAVHGAASRGANDLVRFLASAGAKLDVMSKPTTQTSAVDNEPPLEVPGQTPIDAALDADPPRLETVKLLRELMGEDPNAPMRAPSKKR